MAKIDKAQFVVGERWYFVPCDKRQACYWLEITKVGHRFVHFRNSYFQVDLLADDFAAIVARSKNYGTEGHLFKTTDDYEAWSKNVRMRSSFYSQITDRNFMKSLTDKQITEAAKILGIDLEKSE